MRRWGGPFALIAVVAVIVSLAQTGPGYALLKDAGLYKEPASYTELAFSAPANLPARLTSKETSVRLAFRIRNVSGSSRGYRWSVVLVHAGRSKVAASGAVAVPAQGQISVAKTLPLTCTGGRLQVIVRLADPRESVDFWATCGPAARSKR